MPERPSGVPLRTSQPLASPCISNTTLPVSYEKTYDRRTADRGIPSRFGLPYDTASSTFFGNAGQSYSAIRVDAFSAVLDHEFNNGWHLKNTLRTMRYDKFYQNSYPGSAVAVNNPRP